MINESFVCEHCDKEVSKHPSGSARNHCPFCLYSKHLDDTSPGDRASRCQGLMEPIGMDTRKNKGTMIIHQCQKCQKKMLNKLAPDDDLLSFMKQYRP
ncbi:MAG: RNHCP domain-containing protein [Candidatus Peribacteria bacterium]|nr:MAG: RNHCP domain-containing protein [Candidatus Peribacteria bacterium]